jgi:hypothetical protein
MGTPHTLFLDIAVWRTSLTGYYESVVGLFWRCRVMGLRLSGTSGIIAAIAWASLAQAQVRIVNWNLAELRGDSTSIEYVIDAIATDDHSGFAAPVTLMLLQEVDYFTHGEVSGMLGAQWSAATYTNNNEDAYGGAQACFYHAATMTEVPSGHADLFTGAGRRADRWEFTLNGYVDPPVRLYVYSAHLKAGNSSDSESQREVGALRILEDIATLPSGSRYIVTGDMNFYDNGELGYLAFLAGNVLEDPLGAGSWSGSGNAIKHSQSPRKIQADGLASGGMDDRFDFQLISPLMQGTDGLCVIAGTYRSFGNDGNHYDIAINDGNNSYWPGNSAGSNSLANALWAASDHIPVVADYRVPAILDTSFGTCSIGRVLEGYPLTCSVDIANGASSVTPAGSAVLAWSMSGTGVLGDNDDLGSLPAGNAQTVPVLLDTSVAGAFDDQLTINATGDLTQHAPTTMSVSGQILRHANPSFVSDGDNDFYVYYVDVEADSGVLPLAIQFWNYQWDDDQSRMDIDSVSVPEAPFAFLGSSWNNVGPFPVSMPFEFDTTGLAPGNYISLNTIVISDEDLPGESSSSLQLTFNITVLDSGPDCVGDVTGDGVTDVSDLLAFLKGFGGSDPALDLVVDGIVDVNDMLVLVGDFSCGL